MVGGKLSVFISFPLWQQNTQDKSAGKRKSAFGFTAARGPSPEFSDSTALARDESGYLDGARYVGGVRTRQSEREGGTI